MSIKCVKKVANINICQWNSRSLKSKFNMFKQFLIQEKIHIAAVSETWLATDDALKLNDFFIYRQDRDIPYRTGGGGVAFLIHRSIKSERVPIVHNNPGLEIIHIKIYNCSQIENIICVYCSSEVVTIKRDWERLFSLFSRKSIILGDFNGHHVSWSYKSDTRGKQIFECLFESDYVVLNDGSPTRFQLVQGNLRQSSPDLSLVTSDIASILNWTVTKESLGSDHIILKIGAKLDIDVFIQKKRNFKKADWSKYTSHLNESFSKTNFPDDVQSAYNIFIEIVNNAADLFIPFVNYCQFPDNNFNPKPYWNPELSRSVALRRLALANFRRNPTPQNRDILLDKVRESQRLIRIAERKAWHSFCDSIDGEVSNSQMWSKMKWFKGRFTHYTQVDKDKAYSLLQSLCPDFVMSREPEIRSLNSVINICITLQELEGSIKAKDTAPGHDEISYSMIKKIPKIGKLYLLKLYNLVLDSGFVPFQWRDIRVVPIPKPGRDSQSISSLRPISLISCVCKIFHTIINKRMEWFLEKNMVFSDTAFGFRKSKSCLDNLSLLVTQIQTGFANNCATLGCFVDIDNAYNNVDLLSLLSILDRLDVGSNICTYVWNFLKERRINIKTDNTFISRNCYKGLAQGDPLSPLLFNVASIDICKRIKNVNIMQYADDFVLYVTGNNMNQALSELQSALNLLTELLAQLGLNLSPSKSKLCIFKKRPYTGDLVLKIDDIPLEIVQNVKYLGLWLDRSLTWGKHINEIHAKCSKFLNILKVLAGSGWGVHPLHLRRIYISIIRSRMDYASFLFNDACYTHLKKIVLIQNQSMRIIAGFIKSTPIHVMESELALQPLHIRRQFLASKFILKNKALKSNPVLASISKLSSLCENNRWRRRRLPLLVHTINLLQVQVHSSDLLDMFSLNTWVSYINVAEILRPSITSIDKPKRTYRHGKLMTSFIAMCTSEYEGFYKIFTDGSKDKNGCGAAVYDPQLNLHVKFKISSTLSIMHIELLAIAEALSYIRSIAGNNFVLFTDSKSALYHVARCSSTFRGFPIAYTILNLVYELQNLSKKIFMQWIPSHCGIVGNERVDILAKQASTDGVLISCLPFFTECMHEAKRECMFLWKEYFDERSKSVGIWYKTIQPEPLNSPWINNCLKRQDLVLALRIRSGHIPLNKFAHMMRKLDSPNCSECDVVEDVYHILMECVRNQSVRFNLLIMCSVLKEVGGCNSVLASPLSKEAKSLYKLVRVGLKLR